MSTTSPSPPQFATQESVDSLTELVKALHAKIDSLMTLPQSTVPVPSTVIPPSSPTTTNVTYASIVRALAESDKIRDKSQRAVLVGSSEKSTPAETAEYDEAILKEIIEATHDKDLKDAYTAGSITHRRFPENMKPGRRIVKYSLPSSNLRDKLLHGIRTVGRPASFEPSMYIRRDLMPSELEQERIARDEARKRNVEADCLKFGVRDCELIQFRGPHYRPLPKDYRIPNEKRIKPTANSNHSIDQSKLSTTLTTPFSTGTNETKSMKSSEPSTTIPVKPITVKPTNENNVTMRKKEDPAPTPSPPSSVSSGGTTATDQRAPKLQ